MSRNNGWNSIENYPKTSQKVQMRERPCPARLRVINAGFKEDGPGRTEEEWSLEELSALYRGWMSIDWTAQGNWWFLFDN